MARGSKNKRRHRGPKNSAALRTKSDKASAKQIRYVEWLRDQFDPLKSGSEIPTTKTGAGAEIARLLQLKAKYEAMTRPPSGRTSRGSGQYRYPTAP
jgi:hypothetical protein